MSEEKKNNEEEKKQILKEEDLGNVSGGTFTLEQLEQRLDELIKNS